MKTRLWMSLTAAAVMTFAGTSCNDDWGKVDPPAGNQVYPTLQNVTKITFEDEDGNPALPENAILKASTAGANPEVLVDDNMKSAVLATNGGSVTLNNPMNAVKCQNAVGVTFWVKQILDANDEGKPVDTSNAKGALISFVNEGQSFSFAADGTVSYKTEKGSYSDTDAYVTDSLYMVPNTWHFVALSVSDAGYTIVVDGKDAVTKDVPTFKEQEIVAFLNNAPKIEIGSASTAPIVVEDLNFYRNSITEKEWKRPNKGNVGGGSEEGEVDIFVDPMFGPENNEQGWWSIWSPSVNLEGDGTIHFEFTNYTLGNQNWENWVLVLTNSGLTPNDEGYAGDQELIVLRADAYGWAALYGGATIESDYNWDTFRSDMDGAHVSIDITRAGNTVVMNAVTTTAAKKVYHYKVTVPGVTCDMIGAFFTLENAHMVFDVDATFVGQSYESGTKILGKEDFSNGFWSCWTDMMYLDKPFLKRGFEFVNHSAKGGNWQFWNLVVTNGYQSAPDGERDPQYCEYYYLRCDAYGWGDLYGASAMTHNFNWDTFIEDMDGARSRIYFSYEDGTLTMVARQWKADGTPIPEYRFVTPEVGLPVGLIFTCEGSWLDFLRIGRYPWARLEAK